MRAASALRSVAVTPTRPRPKGRRMSTDAKAPDTIVLIHGFWVTPRSWEDWKARYESRGYRVLTPAYPGFEVEVEALNADPTPIEELTVPAVGGHLESVVSQIEPAPILMGHSAGGVFTQLVMDRGYGAAGVAINSAPTEGVKRLPLSQIRSSFPVLKNPANRHKAVGFTFEQWRYVFTKTFSEYEGRAHLMPSQTGWEEIADYALSWATAQAAVWAARRPLSARA